MLYIHQAVIADLKIASENLMEECCGFLYGWEKENQRVITCITQAVNEAENRITNFRISAKAYMDAEAFASNNSLQLVGIYHSHPNHLAVPSERDRIAALPYFSYIITSVRSKQVVDIRSWQLNKNFKFEEETLTIIHKNKPIYGHRNHTNTAA
jgi:proteasome lid subunit RPN8/RPN11